MFISTISHGRINSVKYSKKICLSEDKESSDIIFMSKELPAPEFESAMTKVANQLCKQFGISLDDQQASLKNLRIDYHDVEGVNSDITACIHVTRNEGGIDAKIEALGCSFVHPSNELERRVKNLILKATDFVNGQKAQGDLDFDDKAKKTDKTKSA